MSFKEKLFKDNSYKQSFEEVVEETIEVQNENTTSKKYHRAEEVGKGKAKIFGYLKIAGVLGAFGVLGILTLMLDLKLSDLEREEQLGKLKIESVQNLQRLSLQSRMVFDHDEE